jgi:hypothetical protein
METARSPEKSVNFYQNTRRQSPIPEYSIFYSDHRQNFKHHSVHVGARFHNQSFLFSVLLLYRVNEVYNSGHY